MAINITNYRNILSSLNDKATLVAVSKTKPAEDIQAMYDLGQRDFGENYVQELIEKKDKLPGTVRWHFIGHLQSNKVKYITPFVYLIQGVDSLKLLLEINKEAGKCHRVVNCLLQVHIATEETKFGFNEEELQAITLNLKELKNVSVRGLMGMASFSNDTSLIRNEFKKLKQLFDNSQRELIEKGISAFNILSMGMSSDYELAIKEGSNMIRIGSLLFGERNYTK